MAHATSTIEIHLKSPEQLFNSLDPSPFHDRDIDDKAERYIMGSARELRSRNELHLVVTLPPQACASKTAQHIPDAIANYFDYRAGQTRQDLRELLRVGWQFLMIGLSVLVICLLGIHYVPLLLPQGTASQLAEQSLLIIGWVANWRPLEIFLYDWLPLRRQLTLQKRLSRMKVEVRPGDISL